MLFIYLIFLVVVKNICITYEYFKKKPYLGYNLINIRDIIFIINIKHRDGDGSRRINVIIIRENKFYSREFLDGIIIKANILI